MKKKVAIIRAILHNPRILLLDEPTNGLDPVSTMKLREMLLTLAKENHTTIIMTTHNLEEVQKLCNKISIFHIKNTLQLLHSQIQYLQQNKQHIIQAFSNPFISFIAVSLTICSSGPACI